MKRIPRRIFTEEFKREAIKLVNEQGLTLADGIKTQAATSSIKTKAVTRHAPVGCHQGSASTRPWHLRGSPGLGHPVG